MRAPWRATISISSSSARSTPPRRPARDRQDVRRAARSMPSSTPVARDRRRRPARREHAALNVPQTAIRLGGTGPEARRSGLHRRLCRRPDPRRRHVLLAPLQGGARGSRARLFGRHRASFPTTMPAPSSPRPRSTRRTPARRVKIMLDEIKRYADRGPDRGGARRDQGLPGRQFRAALRFLAEDRAQPAAASSSTISASTTSTRATT